MRLRAGLCVIALLSTILPACVATNEHEPKSGFFEPRDYGDWRTPDDPVYPTTVPAGTFDGLPADMPVVLHRLEESRATGHLIRPHFEGPYQDRPVLPIQWRYRWGNNAGLLPIRSAVDTSLSGRGEGEAIDPSEHFVILGWPFTDGRLHAFEYRGVYIINDEFIVAVDSPYYMTIYLIERPEAPRPAEPLIPQVAPKFQQWLLTIRETTEQRKARFSRPACEECVPDYVTRLDFYILDLANERVYPSAYVFEEADYMFMGQERRDHYRIRSHVHPMYYVPFQQ